LNFFDLAGLTTNYCEHEPLNSFNSIDAILLESNEPLDEYFWAEPQPVSPWNSYWNEAAKYGGGLQINNLVFKDSWTKYYGLHINCEDEECYCEHNCGGTHTTKGWAVSCSNQTETIWDFAPPKQCVLFPTISEIENVAVPATTPFWTNYQQRKLNKANAIDQELHPTPHPILLIIIPPTDGHEVFMLELYNQFFFDSWSLYSN
jgi:hypothetical protein